MMPGDDDAAEAQVPVRPKEPKGTSEIGIDKFKSGVDDFDEYVEMFEKAVDLATKATAKADKEKAYWDWLLLRLDKPARAILSQAEATIKATAQTENRQPTWQELKDELKTLLIDPHEAYKWHAKLMTIKWDGVESFHALASRVISAVNKFDKAMDDAYKKRECFLRFRMALPKEPYQDSIDMKIGFTSHSINDAILIAQRVQLTQTNKGENLCFASEGVSEQCVPAAHPTAHPFAFPTALGAPIQLGAPPTPNFNPGSGMDELMTPTIETSLASINTRLDGMSLDMRSFDSRLGALERDVDGWKRGACSSQQSNPYFWPPQTQYQPPYPLWSSQQYFPTVPHSQNSPNFPQNYPSHHHGGHNQTGTGGQESHGGEASGHESEMDLEVELARQRAEMEKTMARLESKRKGY